MIFQLRKNADNGEWMSLLLPLCLIRSAVYSHDASKINFAVLIWLLLSHGVKKILQPKSRLKFDTPLVFYAVLSVPASFGLSWYTNYGIVFSYLTCLSAVLSYNYIISTLLVSCPGSFTIGEVQVIVQGIVIFLLCSLDSFKQNNYHLYNAISFHDEAMDLLKLLLFGLFLLLCSVYSIPPLRKNVQFHFACCLIATVMIIFWTLIHEQNVLIWFLEFCVNSSKRVFLLLFWLCLTIASVLFVVWINKRPGYSTSTLDRKYFHFVINAVYISGVLMDVQLLCFASGIALGAFIVLETYRILKIPVIGEVIDQAFHTFLDEKDSGLLILTHIYLLIGCSCPIWLSSYYVDYNKYHISLLSGIISVGFGDTFAAIGGTYFGKNFWRGSKKTIEGTVCGIIAQLMCSYYFLQIGHHLTLYNFSITAISILFTSLLEAKTNQVDNLVLPLFMMSFLSWIH